MKTIETILSEKRFAGNLWSYIEDPSNVNIVNVVKDCIQTYADQFKQDWVSVEDRLPEPNEIVLLFTKYNTIWQGYTYRDKSGWSLIGGQIEDFVYVTHWQPLPPPPTK